MRTCRKVMNNKYIIATILFIAAILFSFFGLGSNIDIEAEKNIAPVADLQNLINMQTTI